MVVPGLEWGTLFSKYGNNVYLTPSQNENVINIIMC